MKPLVVFYSFCIVGLYSALTFIGYRKEKFGNINGGILAEVTVSAPVCKTAESKLLAQHFDDALTCLKEKQKDKAAKQIYDALMVFTMRAISYRNYNHNEFWPIVKNLTDCYIAIKADKPITLSKINEVFESSELFVAKEFILKSSEEFKSNHFSNSIEAINKAEEGIALAAKYSNRYEAEFQKRIFNNSVELLNEIIKERNSSAWKRAVRKMDNLEGSA